MKKTYTYMNKAEIHYQIGGSQEIGRTSDVTSIRVEVSDKVQIQTSTGSETPNTQEKEESSRPNDKLINEEKVESSYQGEKALYTDSIRQAEIHHELGPSNTNANKTSTSKEEIHHNHKAELTERTSEIISILTEESHLGETLMDSSMQRGQ